MGRSPSHTHCCCRRRQAAGRRARSRHAVSPRQVTAREPALRLPMPRRFQRSPPGFSARKPPERGLAQAQADLSSAGRRPAPAAACRLRQGQFRSASAKPTWHPVRGQPGGRRLLLALRVRSELRNRWPRNLTKTPRGQHLPSRRLRLVRKTRTIPRRTDRSRWYRKPGTSKPSRSGRRARFRSQVAIDPLSIRFPFSAFRSADVTPHPLERTDNSPPRAAGPCENAEYR